MTDEELRQKLDHIQDGINSLQTNKGYLLLIIVLIVLLARGCS